MQSRPFSGPVLPLPARALAGCGFVAGYDVRGGWCDRPRAAPGLRRGVPAMRRALLVLLLPVIWLPLLALSLAVLPRLPWWSLLLALAVYFLLWRRRSRPDEAALSEDSPRYSPLAGGGY